MSFGETICFPCSSVGEAARGGHVAEIERLVAEG